MNLNVDKNVGFVVISTEVGIQRQEIWNSRLKVNNNR